MALLFNTLTDSSRKSAGANILRACKKHWAVLMHDKEKQKSFVSDNCCVTRHQLNACVWRLIAFLLEKGVRWLCKKWQQVDDITRGARESLIKSRKKDWWCRSWDSRHGQLSYIKLALCCTHYARRVRSSALFLHTIRLIAADNYTWKRTAGSHQFATRRLIKRAWRLCTAAPLRLFGRARRRWKGVWLNASIWCESKGVI